MHVLNPFYWKNQGDICFGCGGQHVWRYFLDICCLREYLSKRQELVHALLSPKQQRWIEALGLQDIVKNHHHVCTRHFPNGDTSNDPQLTLNKHFAKEPWISASFSSTLTCTMLTSAAILRSRTIPRKYGSRGRYYDGTHQLQTASSLQPKRYHLNSFTVRD